MKRSIVAAAVLLAGFGSVCPARAASFQGLGQPPGGPSGGINDLSADGSAVIDNPGSLAHRWTEAEGWIPLGTLPGYSRSFALAVSGDGSVVVGYSRSSGTPYFPFRWTQPEGMVALPTPFGDGETYVVTPDGSTIFGLAGTEEENEWAQVRWTEGEGMVYLPSCELEPHDVSADGTVLVGYVYRWDDVNSPRLWKPALWSEETGTVGLGLELSTSSYNTARAVLG